MTNVLDPGEFERRATQYWNADGLPELGMGLLWMVWGSAWLIGQSIPAGGAARMFWTIVPWLLIVTSLGALWAIKQVKARVTFPRTGYVEWKPPSGVQRFTAGAVALIAAAVIVAVARRQDLQAVVMPTLGVLLGAAFVVASLRQRAPSMLVLAAVALVLGLGFGAAGLGVDAINWLFLALGAATALVGAVRLTLFLRRHPVESQ